MFTYLADFELIDFTPNLIVLQEEANQRYLSIMGHNFNESHSYYVILYSEE